MSASALFYCGGTNRQAVILSPSATVTASGTGTAVSQLGEFVAFYLQLDVTAAATASGDKLDVYLQTTIDGTNWLDIYHFTQLAGNGGAKRYFAKFIAADALTEFENGTALIASGGRAILGDSYRVRWAVTNSSAPSFTFSVTANLQ